LSALMHCESGFGCVKGSQVPRSETTALLT
jgi:hypothetical protein